MTKNQPPRTAVPRKTALGLACATLATAPLLVAPPSAAAAAPAGAAVAVQGTVLAADRTTSTTVKGHVTDDAGILDREEAEEVVAQVRKDGAALWVVTMRDSSTTADKWAARAWEDSGFGTQDLLLVINVPDSGVNTFSFDGSRNNSVWSASKRQQAAAAIQEKLSQGEYDDAVAAVAKAGRSAGGSSDRSADDSSDESAIDGGALVGAAAALGGGAAAVGGVMAYRRARKRKQAAGPGVPADGSQVSTEQLQKQAGAALVATDNAVRAAAEELAYAQAQFGLSATDSFSQALERAQEHVTASFELRKRLDDDVPETEQQQRAMLGEIIRRCESAHQELKAQEGEFSRRRGIEANLPTALAETRQRAEETAGAIEQSRSVLVTLQAIYPASSLASVASAPEQAERLLAAARTALAQAQTSVESGQQAAAVEQVRIAQASIGQAGTLAAQVTSTRERLEGAAQALVQAISSISADLTDAKRLEQRVPAAVLEPLVKDAEQAVAAGRQASGSGSNSDPLAALDRLAKAESALDQALASAREAEENDRRAATQLAGRLSRLSSQVEAVTTYITTNRGAVGPQARTALSEASRHLATATAQQRSEPSAALAEVAAAEPLVAQAQSLAEADVRHSSYQQGPWGSGGHGPFGGNGGRGGGIDLGSLVLGGILLGGGRGGYGGWGSSGDRDWDFDLGDILGGGGDGGGFGGGFGGRF